MELNAVPKTINDLLSVKKKYVVPRFQREFQWTPEKVRDLWEDVTYSVRVSKNGTQLEPTEYFIGPLVLIGKDTSTQYQIVDGQQRLTTITLFLRALVNAFDSLDEKAMADALFYDYVEGKDDDGKPFFKLQNESPRPFFQKALQTRDPNTLLQPKSEEEKCLRDAFVLCTKLLSATELSSRFPNVEYIDALKGIRDQFLRFVKVIYVTVADEDDAYTIFETLNARGIDLSSYDLVRNSILKRLNKVHPNDDAKDRWKAIRENCKAANVPPDTFLRHYWLSRFGNTTEDRLYKSFKLKQKDADFPESDKFLLELEAGSYKYLSIAVPVETDWKEKHKKANFRSLRALSLFRLTQVRPLLLAVLESSVMNDTDRKTLLTILEHFHFSYTAVCSMPAYGIDRKYGKTARDLRNVTTRAAAKKIATNLADELREKLPSLDAFQEHFAGLTYSYGDDSGKRLIQYFFEKYEAFLRKSTELVPSDITLEHISSQKFSSKNFDQIGNLIPLAEKLNGIAAAKNFADKLIVYKDSQFRVTKDFVNRYDSKDTWTTSDVEERSKLLGKIAFEKVFRVTASYFDK